MYICPIILALTLACICAFLALVRHGTARLERGNAPESYGDVDAWRASLDVELGDSWFQPTRRARRVVIRAGEVRPRKYSGKVYVRANDGLYGARVSYISV